VGDFKIQQKSWAIFSDRKNALLISRKVEQWRWKGSTTGATNLLLEIPKVGGLNFPTSIS